MQIRRKTARLWGIGAGVSAALILALLATFGFRAGVAHANDVQEVHASFCTNGVCCTVSGIIGDDPYVCDLSVDCSGVREYLECDPGASLKATCLGSPIDTILVTASCGQSPSVWLADVCQPYYGGMYDQYGQITFDTDHGTTLYVGPSAEGPWTAVQANGPPWVLTMSELDAMAANLGVATTELWVTTGNGGAYAEARLLSSMATARAAGWGEDCTPVDGGPAE